MGRIYHHVWADKSPYLCAQKKKYGKNAILKGTNLTEGATAIERNEMIGGHKA